MIGLLAGVAGLCTTLLLRFVEHLTYHYSFGTLLAGVTESSPVRRAVGPMIGGALAGFGWWILRRRTEVPPLTETILNHGPIPRLTMTIDAALQVLSSARAHLLAVRVPPANSPLPLAISAPPGGH